MSNVVVSLILLVGSLVESSDAVSCYSCSYLSLSQIPQQGATCPEPFNAASTPKCNGPVCEFIYQGVSGQYEYYGVTRNCTNQVTFQLDQCLTYSDQYKQSNYTFFIYGNSCCYSYTGNTNDGAKVQVIGCQCLTDNCNGDLPHTVPNAGFPLQPVSKIPIGVVAIIAVLSKMSW